MQWLSRMDGEVAGTEGRGMDVYCGSRLLGPLTVFRRGGELREPRDRVFLVGSCWGSL